MSAALQGMRVLELADERGEYAGKLLADLGAEVCKVEPPEGERSRRISSTGSPKSAGQHWFRYANTSKRSLILDLATDAGKREFHGLAEGVDLILETRGPGYLEGLGLGFSELRASNPALVLARISGFGQGGPRAGWRSSDLVASALSGAAYTTGWPEEPPMSLAGFPAYMMGGTAAAAGALVAVRAARQSGRGECVDISLQEVMASVSHVVGVGRYLEDGVISCREGSGLTASVPSGVWETMDGAIYLTVNRPAHWAALARWVAETTGNEAILEPIFEGPSSNRQEYRDVIDAWLADHFSHRTVEESYRVGQQRHIAISPLQNAEQLLADPHLQDREFFVRPTPTSSLYPGPPYRHAATPWRIANLAPALGEGGVALQKHWAAPASPASPPGLVDSASGPRQAGRSGEDSLPAGALAGLRVLEFTAGMAGPWAGRLMAYHGAEVVKIESRSAADVTRLYVSPKNPEVGISEVRSPWFTDWNAGKSFVGLNLKTPEGRAIALQLAARADVVIENFVPGAMQRLDLDFATLARRNPGLIYLATSGFGQSGPSSSYVSWGPNIEAVSGLAALSGLSDHDATITQYAYSDPVAALHGLVAVMAALAHRDRTGEGQFIDLAQVETCAATIGDLLLAALEGERPSSQGNRRAVGAPYGMYPCEGEDRWVAITIETDSQWEAFCRLVQRREWLTDERFRDITSRRTHAELLDRLVADWTRSMTAEAVMEQLQNVGIPAGVAQHVEDLVRRDPQLAARDFFEEIAHCDGGRVLASRPGFRLQETGGRTTDTGRAIGADNERVLAQWLGFSADDLDHHRRAGILEQ